MKAKVNLSWITFIVIAQFVILLISSCIIGITSFYSKRDSISEMLKANTNQVAELLGKDLNSIYTIADTEVYSHIIDEDRRRNATLLEDSFYNRKNLNPQIHDTEKRTMMEVPEGVDAELLAKVLSNPEMAVLLTSLAKSMQGEHN